MSLKRKMLIVAVAVLTFAVLEVIFNWSRGFYWFVIGGFFVTAVRKLVKLWDT